MTQCHILCIGLLLPFLEQVFPQAWTVKNVTEKVLGPRVPGKGELSSCVSVLVIGSVENNIKTSYVCERERKRETQRFNGECTHLFSFVSNCRLSIRLAML